jgi:hypothetical protein
MPFQQAVDRTAVPYHNAFPFRLIPQTDHFPSPMCFPAAFNPAKLQ